MSISLPRRNFGNKSLLNPPSAPAKPKSIWESEPILQLIYGLQQGRSELVTEIINQASWPENKIYMETVKVWQGSLEAAENLTSLVRNCGGIIVRNWVYLILSLFWLEMEEENRYRKFLTFPKEKFNGFEAGIFLECHRKALEIIGKVRFKESCSEKDLTIFESIENKHIEGLKAYLIGLTSSSEEEVKSQAINRAISIFSSEGESPNLYWWSKALIEITPEQEAEKASSLQQALNGLLQVGREQEAIKVSGKISNIENKYATAQEMEGCLYINKGQEMLHKAGWYARGNSPVLILGETGVGKSALARRIHNHPLSVRRDRPFVEVNCGTLPKDLAAGHLFGTIRGAFTGAENTLGLLEKAKEGTVFLDEIGELDPAVQTMLLGVIGEGYFRRVGSSETIKFKGRIIAATNRNIFNNEISTDKLENRFRSDLLWRLNKSLVIIPPLRERKNEIVPLAKHFLKQLGTGKLEFAPLAAEELENYDFPGNIRELQNIIEQLVISVTEKYQTEGIAVITQPMVERVIRDARGTGLRVIDTPSNNSSEAQTTDVNKLMKLSIRELHKQEMLNLAENVDLFTVTLIEECLELANGKVSEAAKLLKAYPMQIYRIIQKVKVPEIKK
jgi:transcriptional regulator with GAF, ATPase, and Fis domain